MNINFGKHAGKSVELLILKEPHYIMWVLDQTNAAGALATVRDEVIRLIVIFDNKKFIKECFSCHKAATRCTVYMDNVLDPNWWCEHCDPYRTGATQGNIQVLVAYEHALRHVQLFCDGRKSDYKSIIRSIAEAKGLPTHMTKRRAETFFSTI